MTDPATDDAANELVSVIQALTVRIDSLRSGFSENTAATVERLADLDERLGRLEGLLGVSRQ